MAYGYRRRQHHYHTQPHHHTHQPYSGAPVHHQKRHASLTDKVSGAMLKLQGILTRRPGKKAAGTRRMRGTDGRDNRLRKNRHHVL